MFTVLESESVAKKKAAVPGRVTILNVKGTEKERDYLAALSDEYGVPVAEIVRRGIAAWAKGRGSKAPLPAGWKAE